MGHDPRRMTYKLVALNGRCQCLGAVVVDDIEQRYEARCNDCVAWYGGARRLTDALDWLETHDHDRLATVLPMTDRVRESVDG